MELADFLLNRNTAQTTKVTLTGELAEYEFEIRALNNDEWENCRSQCMSFNKNGSVSLNNAKLNAMIVVTGCINPNFRSAELLAKAGITLPIDFVNKVLKPGEVEKLANQILQYSGFGDNLGEIQKK